MTWYIRHHSFFYGLMTIGPLRSFDQARNVARTMGSHNGRLPHITTRRDRGVPQPGGWRA